MNDRATDSRRMHEQGLDVLFCCVDRIAKREHYRTTIYGTCANASFLMARYALLLHNAPIADPDTMVNLSSLEIGVIE